MIDESLIKVIVDDSPLKVNRYSPGKHIPIKSFDSIKKGQLDIIILFAYEYFNSIKIKFTSDEISFFKPIPLEKLTEVNK